MVRAGAMQRRRQCSLHSWRHTRLCPCSKREQLLVPGVRTSVVASVHGLFSSASLTFNPCCWNFRRKVLFASKDTLIAKQLIFVWSADMTDRSLRSTALAFLFLFCWDLVSLWNVMPMSIPNFHFLLKKEKKQRWRLAVVCISAVGNGDYCWIFYSPTYSASPKHHGEHHFERLKYPNWAVVSVLQRKASCSWM